jgi:hypothetical protein
MVLVKKHFMSHFGLTANTQVFLKAQTKLLEMAQNSFLFGCHLRSSTFNDFVNHFGNSLKCDEFQKLCCSPSRWRLLFHSNIFSSEKKFWLSAAEVPYRRTCEACGRRELGHVTTDVGHVIDS